MRIEKISRWWWMALGLVVGLALGLVYRGSSDRDLSAAFDVIGDQGRFESMLLDHDGDTPRFRQLVVHPGGATSGKHEDEVNRSIVTGRYFDGAKDSVGRALCFEAPVPYTQGPALERVAKLAKQDLAGRYKAIQSPSIADYLSLLGEFAAIDYQYAWWEIPWVSMLLWSGGGVMLIGLLWPTAINLIVYKRLTRPREAGIDLRDIRGESAQPQSQPSAQDDQRLREIETEMQAGLERAVAMSPEDAGKNTVATPPAVRELSEAAIEAAAPADEPDQHFAAKPDDFYPTDHSPKRRAFTLLELLIAIGIIALLIGILLPVVAVARKRGQATKCASNLRQIGMELEIYSQTNRQLPDTKDAATLAAALAEIDQTGGQIFQCPSDDASKFSYSLNPQFAGLPKTAGKATDMLANESGARHIGGANALFFDGHVEAGGK